ncbi:MAG: GNAT family N-acetyltransferase, partial [Segetibacter sp.]
VTVESKVRWFNEHGATNRPLWIIADEIGQTIGWVSFQSFYGRPAYNATVEISIYLDPGQRGKGLGKLVLQHCIEVAPAYGVKTLLGFIFAHNKPSLSLFYKLGFKDWGTFPNVANLDGVERTLKILGKRVG